MGNTKTNTEENIVPFMVKEISDSCMNCEFMQKDGLVCGILKHTKELYTRSGKNLNSAEFSCNLHKEIKGTEEPVGYTQP